VSKDICGMLHDRILQLKSLGLNGLWLRADSKDSSNAGTVLGYTDEQWNVMKKHSGLWKSDGQIIRKEVWVKKLGGISVKFRDRHQFDGCSQSVWFAFEDKIDVDTGRSTRGSYSIPIADHLESSTPGDEASLERIYLFHKKMEDCRVHYAMRFSQELKTRIRSLERYVEVEDVEDPEELVDPLAERSLLEELFSDASKSVKEKLVREYFLEFKVYFCFSNISYIPL